MAFSKNFSIIPFVWSSVRLTLILARHEKYIYIYITLKRIQKGAGVTASADFNNIRYYLAFNNVRQIRFHNRARVGDTTTVQGRTAALLGAVLHPTMYHEPTTIYNSPTS